MGMTALKRSLPGRQGRYIAREMRSGQVSRRRPRRYQYQCGTPTMSKRMPKKTASKGKRADATAGLRKALNHRSKAELVSALLELAQGDRAVLRQLTARFNVAPAPDELVA